MKSKKDSGMPRIYKVPLNLYFEAVGPEMATALGEVYAHRLTEILVHENSGWNPDKVSIITTNGPIKEIKSESVPKESYDRKKIIDNIGEEMGFRLINFRRGADKF